MSPHARKRPLFTPLQPPPQGAPPSPKILEAMGEEGVCSMLEDFYLLLEKSPVRELFPADMPAASRKSAAFFVQLLGGRSLYSERYGPPRLRQRHEPFEIDARARAIWLEAFEEILDSAIERHGFPPEHRAGFQAFLHSFSGWMVNAE